VCLQGMVMLILATDMARHSEILETFKAKIDKFDFANEDHLNSVRQIGSSAVSLNPLQEFPYFAVMSYASRNERGNVRRGNCPGGICPRSEMSYTPCDG